MKEYRQYQKELILSIDNALNKYNYIVVEAPTGSGKSAVAITFGRKSQDAYVLTVQKLLQSQYMNDENFQQYGLAEIKGANNYVCACDETGMLNCRYGLCKIDKSFECKGCPYKEAREHALNSPIAILNYSYFLYAANYAHQIRQRDLLIIDEAHNIEDELMKFISVSISTDTLRRLDIFDLIPAELYMNLEDYLEWLKDICKKVEERKNEFEDEISSIGLVISDNKKMNDVKKLANKIEFAETLLAKVEMMIEMISKQPDNWVYNSTAELLEFKPIFVRDYAYDKVFRYGKQVIMMSATILNKAVFCSSLGLNVDDVCFIKVSSTFPKENRPIYFEDCGRMDITNIENSLPIIAKKVDEILEKHKNQKGIIHTHTYRIRDYLQENCKNSDRFIVHNSDDRHMAYQNHIYSKDNSVLLSPSMFEGIDLKDDLSRFQIIVKLPFPYLGDKQIAKRKELDNDWYIWMTCLALVQAYGRSIRSKDDKAETYVLDSAFPYFLYKNRHFLPDWFIEACVNKGIERNDDK